MPAILKMEILKLPRKRPILVTESVNIDTDRVPIEYGCTVLHGKVPQLVIASDDVAESFKAPDHSSDHL